MIPHPFGYTDRERGCPVGWRIRREDRCMVLLDFVCSFCRPDEAKMPRKEYMKEQKNKMESNTKHASLFE